MIRRKQYIIAAACSLGIGIYDGFYGPGTGTFLLLAFTKLAKMDLEKSTGNVKAVNLASNISAYHIYTCRKIHVDISWPPHV